MRRLAILLLFLLAPALARAEPPKAMATATTVATTPAAGTSTSWVHLELNDAFLRASPDNLYVESRALEKPLLAEWWFWAAVAVGAAGLVATGVILSSGGTFAPAGELGDTTTADWMRF